MRALVTGACGFVGAFLVRELAGALNEVIADARGASAVHLCFGNYGGQTIQEGRYRDLLPFLDALRCDHVVLEAARRGPEDLEALRDLRPGLTIGVGVIDIKDDQGTAGR